MIFDNIYKLWINHRNQIRLSNSISINRLEKWRRRNIKSNKLSRLNAIKLNCRFGNYYSKTIFPKNHKNR